VGHVNESGGRFVGPVSGTNVVVPNGVGGGVMVTGRGVGENESSIVIADGGDDGIGAIVEVVGGMELISSMSDGFGVSDAVASEV